VKIRFLGLDEVLAIHREQVDLYGGTEGVRDLGLLESAVAAPEASFDGAYLHGTLPEMAAAYLFHLAQNHPFLDGNKRVAAASMFLFLYMNDLELECTEDELVELVVGAASSKTTKAEIAVFVSAHVRPVRDRTAP
jgi:death on curing protein